uniref:Uncharacterized protein n=1 Tax=Fusarium oxysporum (strain Fo5176) TaxID=660025 RepID=A0A0D2YKC3_FUSOF
MGQLLVAERALLAVELDEADFPASAVEEMQDRFMTKDARSPISWSLKLRAYGFAVKDNTTSLGYIMWSDDDEILSYKKMHFSMTGLRDLVSAEVEAAQNQLADLLLVPSDTERKHMVPQFSLRSVVDDPSEGAPGWNFTCHPQNEVLHGHRRWIFDRILKEAFLRRDFFENESTAGVSDGPWSATRLSVTLSRTFKLSFGTETNIQMWRHAAIAISRRHLQQAKFKRVFIEAVSWAWNDEMAAHSTKIAGLTYAGGLEEAPGHIAGANAEYRRISREWHAWLGFGGFRNSAI